MTKTHHTRIKETENQISEIERNIEYHGTELRRLKEQIKIETKFLKELKTIE